MSEPTFTFTPYWLGSLPADDADQVREWLTGLGVNINLCPGFDYDGETMTTRYYQTNDTGSAMMNSDGPIFENRVREWRSRNPPRAVQQRMIESKHA